MDTTFSFQSTRSPRLIKSYWLQMLRISPLRYWTRSTGAVNAARPTVKSSRSVKIWTWTFWEGYTSRKSSFSVKRSTSSASTTQRSLTISPVWIARRRIKKSSKRRCGWRKSSGVSKTDSNKSKCSQKPRNSSRESKQAMPAAIVTTAVTRPISKSNRQRKETTSKSKKGASTRGQSSWQSLTWPNTNLTKQSCHSRRSSSFTSWMLLRNRISLEAWNRWAV